MSRRSKKQCRRAIAAPDLFEQLPESLILHILNKVRDIKALGRCSLISRRFHALVPMVDNALVKVDCIISCDDANAKARGFLGSLARLVVRSIVRPIQALQHLVFGTKKQIVAADAYHTPGEVLRRFNELKQLRIELPMGETEVEPGCLLKWKAEFGSTLESCIILGAASLVKQQETEIAQSRAKASSSSVEDEHRENGDVQYTDAELKLRAIWTISSLIAASGRHYLLQSIISEHPTLGSLVLADADGQGVLTMNSSQLQRFRDKPTGGPTTTNRTGMAALNIQLWFAHHLRLPDGIGLEGATLIAIKPNNEQQQDSQEQQQQQQQQVFDVNGCFEEPFQTAANELVKKRTYLLEMNPF